MSYNKITLIGRVGKDPELHETQYGPYASFSLATSERGYTTASGAEVPERTTWHNIIVRGEGLVNKVVMPYVHKGDMLFIEGKQENRTYDKQDGTKGFASEVYVNEIKLLGSRQENQNTTY